MISPTPRPALRKAADAHIHPAAPGDPRAGHLRRAEADPMPDPDTLAPVSALRGTLETALRGRTSDAIRTPQKETGRSKKGAGKGAGKKGAGAEKPVEMTIRLPKGLRNDLRAAAKAQGTDPDTVIAALVRSWLG